MAKKDVFDRVANPRDILVQLRLRTTVSRKSMRKLRGDQLFSLAGFPVGTVAAVKVIESLTTPFELREVVEAGATLEAFGAQADITLKPIADLAAYGDDVARAEKRGREKAVRAKR